MSSLLFQGGFSRVAGNRFRRRSSSQKGRDQHEEGRDDFMIVAIERRGGEDQIQDREGDWGLGTIDHL